MQAGWYAAMYKPYHLIGLELGISVLVGGAARSRPTGQASGWRGDVVAVAKRGAASRPRTLDGEGGYTVWGQARPPPSAALLRGALPIGLAHKVPLKRNIAARPPSCVGPTSMSPDSAALRTRRDMEQRLCDGPSARPSRRNERGAYGVQAIRANRA